MVNVVIAMISSRLWNALMRCQSMHVRFAEMKWPASECYVTTCTLNIVSLLVAGAFGNNQ